jgi:hypothetical protein
LGDVYSDFPGSYQIAHLASERFVQHGPAPAKLVHLRVGIGGIKIQKMASDAPQTLTGPAGKRD